MSVMQSALTFTRANSTDASAKHEIIEGFHDAVRTPCALRADAMLDIFLRGAV